MRPLDSFPDSWGANRAAVVDHAGPSSYIPMQPGSPTAVPIDDGDRVYATEGGLKLITYCSAGIANNGLYEAVAVPLNTSTDTQPSPTSGTTAYGLVWYVINTRTQVTEGVDLSASVVRVLMVGPK